MKQEPVTSPATRTVASKSPAKSATRKAAPARTRKAAPAQAGGLAAPRGQASGEARVEAIRQTAYAYYEARGRVTGHEMEDWLKAEAEFEGHTAGADAEATGIVS